MFIHVVGKNFGVQKSKTQLAVSCEVLPTCSTHLNLIESESALDHETDDAESSTAEAQFERGLTLLAAGSSSSSFGL